MMVVLQTYITCMSQFHLLCTNASSSAQLQFDILGNIISGAKIHLKLLHCLMLEEPHVFKNFDFMVHLCHRASTHHSEDDIGNTVHNTSTLVVSLAFSEHDTARKEVQKDLSAIIAPNQANIISIQTHLVFLLDNSRSSTNLKTWTETNLQRHAIARAVAFAHLTR